MVLCSLAFFILSVVHVGHSAIHQNFGQLATRTPYDFIVAGGGTAGSVIASRLTENPNFRILVLEAGPSNEGIIDIDAPGLVFNLHKSSFDWNFTTVPQVALNGRSLDYTRGHVLGGSSSINAMFYTRGSSDDYNRWATITGDTGWSWNNIFHFILRVSDGHSTAGQFDPAFHNFTGNTFVSLPGFSEPLDKTGWLQTTIGNGTRSSAASSYLGPQFIKRSNLDIVLNTQISRVLTSGNDGSKFDFRTVEFRSGKTTQLQVSKNNDSTLHTVTARKELILSLGSIGTPHILLNSGIGDKTELKKIGIKPILHLPDVGKNLSDQPYVSPNWFVNLTVTPVNATEALNQWLETRTGPLVSTVSNQVAGVEHTDLLIMKEAIASAVRFFAGPTWKDIILGPQGAFSNVTDDLSLVQFIRENSDTALHAVGTAAMSPKGAQFGVVDPDLLVKGATGIRIVDASIMPVVICGHTQAPTYAIAERAAELIKQTWVRD
ncbi:hypothetical protein BDQ17DRAFT_1357086 [Cyathus striatus]|nr:hypothetical protein BDQ17DRAFT_1357086 [Cyathus striatus]